MKALAASILTLSLMVFAVGCSPAEQGASDTTTPAEAPATPPTGEAATTPPTGEEAAPAGDATTPPAEGGDSSAAQ